MKSLPYFIDAPNCFIIDQCLLCESNKPKSKVICDVCNAKGYIKLGIKLRNLTNESI